MALIVDDGSGIGGGIVVGGGGVVTGGGSAAMGVVCPKTSGTRPVTRAPNPAVDWPNRFRNRLRMVLPAPLLLVLLIVFPFNDG